MTINGYDSKKFAKSDVVWHKMPANVKYWSVPFAGMNFAGK